MVRSRHRPLVVVAGVSGSGKTTVGTALARRLGVEYADADDFHSPENVAKMRAGEPLTDQDREPWLTSIGEWLADHTDRGGVVSCSALRRAHRQRLRDAAPPAVVLLLVGDESTLRNRLRDRPGHFMPESLLDSQLQALEPL